MADVQPEQIGKSETVQSFAKRSSTGSVSFKDEARIKEKKEALRSFTKRASTGSIKDEALRLSLAGKEIAMGAPSEEAELEYDHQGSSFCGKFMMPGSHWTENPQAMEMMKRMTFLYAVPALQPRLTKFHGTHIPVKILYFLLSTEVARLARLDHFWKRIVEHPLVWQGVYCRDYDRCGSWGKRCVWRTLEGRAGCVKCLYHLGSTHRAYFLDVCKTITAIPGRLPEELLDAYRVWRKEQKALLTLLDEHNARAAAAAQAARDSFSLDAAAFTSANAAAEATPHKPWQVRAHATYGLGIGHGTQPTSKVKEVLPVLPASAWRRGPRVGRPPNKSLLKQSVRPEAKK